MFVYPTTRILRPAGLAQLFNSIRIFSRNTLLCNSVVSLGLANRPLTLRDYQEDAVTAILQDIENGYRRLGVQIATGGGKTVIFSHLIPRLKPVGETRGNKTMVLVHTQELVAQAVDKIRTINPDLKVEIEIRNLRASSDADVVVASVQSLVRGERLFRFDPMDFKAIIVDECHHAVARSWVKIFTYFEADTSDSEIYVIGFTATLKRGDSEALGSVFDKISYTRSLDTMIHNKELSDIAISELVYDEDLRKVKVKRGDYDPEELSKFMSTKVNIDRVHLAYLELQAKGFKRTLIFCVDVLHCMNVCHRLQQLKVNAQYVTGTTDKTERELIVQDFIEGKIQVLCNVMVFTEGTDIPAIDSIILARPTLSQPLVTQMIGRGLRLHEGKSICHIVDLFGLTKHGILTHPTLDGLDRNVDSTKSAVSSSGSRETSPKPDSEPYVQEIRDYFDQHNFHFETREGIDKIMELSFQNEEVVNAFLRESRGFWMRLEHDVWGVPLHGFKCCLIERTVEEDKNEFEIGIYANKRKPRDISSLFVKQKTHIPFELIETFGKDENLAKVYSKYLSSVYVHQRHFNRKFTERQKNFALMLNQWVIHELSINYGCSKVELNSFFKRKIEAMTPYKLEYFILATLYSTNSIYAKNVQRGILEEFLEKHGHV